MREKQSDLPAASRRTLEIAGRGDAFSLRSRGYFGEVGCVAPTT